MLLGFTKTKNFKDLSDEEIKSEAKEIVMRDFTDKMSFYYLDSGNMIPYSVILYDIFEKRYGFEFGNMDLLMHDSRRVEGARIETDEILRMVSDQLYQGCGREIGTDDIHKFFGVGEFPFINTVIYRFEEYDIITYYISR